MRKEGMKGRKALEIEKNRRKGSGLHNYERSRAVWDHTCQPDILRLNH
jgi:hypothetical protein